GALRAADAPEHAAVDGDVAARVDHALQVAAVDVLVVVVALVVAVVDLAHRGVAPVDDLHPGGAVDEAAAADQHVAGALALAHAQVREVGRAGVDRGARAVAAAGGERGDAGHLLDEGGQVLRLRLGDLVAQRDQVGVVV